MAAENSDALELELRETMRVLVAAELEANLPVLERIIAEDYRGFDPAGRPQDREAILSNYRHSVVRVEALEPVELEVRLFGEIGIVTGRSRIAGRALGERFELRLRFLDVFARRPEGWRLVASQVTPIPSPTEDRRP